MSEEGSEGVSEEGRKHVKRGKPMKREGTHGDGECMKRGGRA